MKTIIDTTETPPGGWSYTEATTGYTMRASSLPDLLDQIEAHRKGNGLLLSPDWRDMVQDEMCRDNPHLGTRCRERKIPRKPLIDYLTVPAQQVFEFFRAMKNWRGANGFHPVSTEVSAARAAICKNCPRHVDKVDGGCTGCQGLLRWVQEFLGQGRQPDPELHYCGVCLCDLNVKTLVPREVIVGLPSIEGRDFPEPCWHHAGKDPLLLGGVAQQ